MVFYSVPFLVLFISASILLQSTKTIKQQHWVILAANIIFYGYWDLRFLFLVASEILVCYLAMLQYAKSGKRFWMILSATVCLLTLAVFKYSNFFVESFQNAFGITDPITLRIIVPLGISFYTFQLLSYIFDVYRNVIPAEKNFVKLAAYISFFPQITSGPIVKARDFLPQLNCLHKIKKENLYRGLQLILLGLTKKIVFADRIGVAVDAVFSSPAAYNGISILFAIVGYSIQIYCDFSGYSDMAIGIAAMWDFDLGKNFNMPYLAKNPSDFWKRWHISLSSWFQEYVYIPLGGSRAGTKKTYCNLFVTMLLSGIWHGANWTFALWGILHALGSIIHKAVSKTQFNARLQKKPIICILGNYIFVSMLWVIFRAGSLEIMGSIFAGLFRWEGIFYINVYVVAYALLILLGNVMAYRRNNGNSITPALQLDTFPGKLRLSIWLFLIIMFAYVGNSAFIYAQF